MIAFQIIVFLVKNIIYPNNYLIILIRVDEFQKILVCMIIYLIKLNQVD